MVELELEQTLGLGDYLSAFKRRLVMILLIGGVVFIIGLITAFVWPPTYQSTSTILIEEQEIPADLVRTTITSYAAQRIQVISQRVMTRSNLLEIVDKYNLYESERKRQTTEEILFNMRENIGIDMITAEVMDPRTGRPTAATIAFTVGFEDENPQLVQQVASELTTLYLNENLRTRTEKTEETYQFLTAEAARLSAEIDQLDAALTAFKEKNINLLPDSRPVIEGQLQRAALALDQVNAEIQSTDVTRTYLRGQLAFLDPDEVASDDIMTPAARLHALRTQYISLYTRYSPDHPDVISTKREIEALEKEVGIVDTTGDQLEQLNALRQELDKATQTYSEEHPDVKGLQRQISILEQEIQDAPAPTRTDYSGRRPINPAYTSLQTQIESADIKIRLLEDRKSKLQATMNMYEDRLMQIPKIEGEYRSLIRDYENTSMRYQEIKAKQMTAEVAQSMEKERKGEKFTLIDPATYPEEPISPNRPAIIFLSLVLALGAGVGSAAVAESMDSAVRGTKGLISVLNTAPLAVIPYLANETDSSKETRRKWILILLAITGIVAILLLIHFLISPLDVLWFRAMRKVDNIIGE